MLSLFDLKKICFCWNKNNQYFNCQQKKKSFCLTETFEIFNRHQEVFLEIVILPIPIFNNDIVLIINWATEQMLNSLVTIRMNEIFPCLACCVKSLIFMFGNRGKDKHKLGETNRRRWNWNNYFKKWYLQCVLNTSFLWSFKNNYTVH